MRRVLLALLFFSSNLVFSDDTVLKLYRPFGEAEEQALPKVMRKISGNCFSQSLLNVREDAWRCQAEGKIFDPCFVKPKGSKTELVCPQSPWIADSVEIQVATPLNNAQHTSMDMSVAFPWAIELVNGVKCQAVDSNEVYDGLSVRYRCTDSNLLIGTVQRCKTTWSMLEKTPVGVETVELKRVWF